MLLLGEIESDSDELGEVEPLGLVLADADELGDWLALGETLGDSLALGDCDALGLTLGLVEDEGEPLLLGEVDGLSLADGEVDAEGETLALLDGLADADSLLLSSGTSANARWANPENPESFVFPSTMRRIPEENVRVTRELFAGQLAAV